MVHQMAIKSSLPLTPKTIHQLHLPQVEQTGQLMCQQMMCPQLLLMVVWSLNWLMRQVTPLQQKYRILQLTP